MHYRVLILEEDPPSKAQPALDTLTKAGRVIRWNGQMDTAGLVAQIDKLIPPDVRVTPVARTCAFVTCARAAWTTTCSLTKALATSNSD